MLNRASLQSQLCLSLLAIIFTTGAIQNSAWADTQTSRIELKNASPDKWWRAPRWSPDGRYVVVQGPAGERIPCPVPRRDGTFGFMFNGGEPDSSMLLRTRDNLIISKIQDTSRAIWSPNSKYFAICTHDGTRNESEIRIYRAYNGLCVCKINLDALPFYEAAVSWAKDGNRLLVADKQSIIVFDMVSRKTRRLSIDSDTGELFEASWSPDGTKILGLSIDKDVKGDNTERMRRLYIWNAHTGSLLAYIDAGSKPTLVSWFPDSSRVLTLEPELFRLFDTDLKELSSIKTSCAPYYWPALLWSPDGQKLACRDHTDCFVLDADNLSTICRIPAARSGRFTMAWPSDNKFLLLVGGRTVALADPATGDYFSSITMPEPIVEVQFGPNNNSLAVSPFSNNLQVIGIAPQGKDNKNRKISFLIDGSKVGSPGWELHAAPKTLEECYAAFDKDLSPANKERFKNTEEKKLDDYGGCGIVVDSLIYDVYNEWDTRALEKSFAEQHITDDRELIFKIIKGYWNYLHKS